MFCGTIIPYFFKAFFKKSISRLLFLFIFMQLQVNFHYICTNF